MIKNLFSSIVFVVLLGFSNAQLTFDTDSSGIIENPAPSYEVVAHNGVTNNSGAPITIKWLRTVNNLPSSWNGSSVCDKVTCWGTDVDSKEVDLGIDSSSIIDVHFFNEGRTGSGYVEILVFDIADSANTVQLLKFYGEANNNVGISNLDTKSLSIYPNPTSNFIQINGVNQLDAIETIEIYSIIGRKVFQKEVSSLNDLKVNVQSFDNGVYLIKLFDKTKNVAYTKTFVKN